MTRFPRAQFLALCAGIINCPVDYAIWRDNPEPGFGPPAAPLQWASLRVVATSRKVIGADDIQQRDNGNGTFTTVTIGRRQIVLGVDCFTWNSNLIDPDADELLAQLVTQIYLPANLDTLNRMSLVIESDGPIIQLPTTINSRAISAAHVDMTVALANTDTQTYAYPGGNQYVGEVQISGDAGTGTLQTVDVISR